MNYKTIEVSEPWAGHIFSGRKIVEMRKNDPNNWGRVRIREKLFVKAKDSSKRVLMVVADVRTYSSLEEAIVAEGVIHLLPGLRTLPQALDVYLEFDGAGPEARAKRAQEFARFGAIVIQLRDDSPVKVSAAADKKTLPKCPHVNSEGRSTMLSNTDPQRDWNEWTEQCTLCGKVFYC